MTVADVGQSSSCFRLRSDGSHVQPSGCSTDYFSDSGQLVGHARCYRWCGIRLAAFRWWRRRLARQLPALDLLRLDPFSAPLRPTGPCPATRPGPGGAVWRRFSWPMPCWAALLAGLAMDPLRLIAEDLGVDHAGGGGVARSLCPAGMKISSSFRGNADTPYLPATIGLIGVVLYRHPRQRHLPELVAGTSARTGVTRSAS